jgi:hypothetical protein
MSKPVAVEYRVALEADPDEFASRLNALAAEGWRVLTSHITEPDEGTISFYALMIRYTGDGPGVEVR